MFVYEKKLQYPVKIANPNPKLAAAIISQYGGPDGELGASLRYLSQRYSMPYPELKGLLTDIGTEELGHLEMVGTIVHQLTRNLTEEQLAGIRQCLSAFGFQTQIDGISTDAVLSATKSDKKMVGNQVKFILLHTIGDAYIYRELSDAQILDGIRYVCRA